MCSPPPPSLSFPFSANKRIRKVESLPRFPIPLSTLTAKCAMMGKDALTTFLLFSFNPLPQQTLLPLFLYFFCGRTSSVCISPPLLLLVRLFNTNPDAAAHKVFSPSLRPLIARINFYCLPTVRLSAGDRPSDRGFPLFINEIRAGGPDRLVFGRSPGRFLRDCPDLPPSSPPLRSGRCGLSPDLIRTAHCLAWRREGRGGGGNWKQS